MKYFSSNLVAALNKIALALLASLLLPNHFTLKKVLISVTRFLNIGLLLRWLFWSYCTDSEKMPNNRLERGRKIIQLSFLVFQFSDGHCMLKEHCFFHSSCVLRWIVPQWGLIKLNLWSCILFSSLKVNSTWIMLWFTF